LKASALLILFLILVGSYVLGSSAHSSIQVSWQLAWILTSIVTGINLVLNSFMSVLEGVNLIGEVAKQRTRLEFIGKIIFFLSLWFGLKLFSVPIYLLVTAIINIIWLLFSKRKFFKDIIDFAHENIINWKKNYYDLDKLFLKTTIQSSTVIAGLGLCFIMLMLILAQLEIKFISRLLDPISILFLLLAAVINQWVQCQAAYLRAHKEDPLLHVSIIGACIQIIVLYLGARNYTIQDICKGNLFITSSSIFILTIFTFVKKRKILHQYCTN
jgi:hypothetical protein